MPVAPVGYRKRKPAPEAGIAGGTAETRQNTVKRTTGSVVPKLGPQLGMKRIRLIARLRT